MPVYFPDIFLWVQQVLVPVSMQTITPHLRERERVAEDSWWIAEYKDAG